MIPNDVWKDGPYKVLLVNNNLSDRRRFVEASFTATNREDITAFAAKWFDQHPSHAPSEYTFEVWSDHGCIASEGARHYA